MLEESKEVTIKGQQYRIGRVKAREGSWMVSRLLGRLTPAVLKQGSIDLGMIASAIADMGEQEFATAQGYCLSAVQRIENGMPMPIFVRDTGAWAIKELEYDVAVVTALTLQAYGFNCLGFFTDGGLEGLMGSLVGSILPNSSS